MNYFDVFQEDQKENNLKKFVPTGFHSIEYTVKSIVNAISNIDSFSDEDLRTLIIKNHDIIFDYDLFLKNDTTREAAQALFQNKRFLRALFSIINTLNLKSKEIICINKITYDYYVAGLEDKETYDLLFCISNLINNTTVVKLYAVLGIDTSRVLAMIANSSFRDEKRVRRVNSFLIRYNQNLTLQDIVNIYAILFNHITCLFIYTMLTPKLPGMNMEELKRFDMISQAMLILLNNLTSQDVKKVLYDYAYLMKLRNNYNVRFGLKSATDYPRIQMIVNQIENEDFEGLVIP